jgi:hypothetical protein
LIVLSVRYQTTQRLLTGALIKNGGDDQRPGGGDLGRWRSCLCPANPKRDQCLSEIRTIPNTGATARAKPAVVRAAAIEPGSEPARRKLFIGVCLLRARDRMGKPLGLTLRAWGPGIWWPGHPLFAGAKDPSPSYRLGDFQLCVSNQQKAAGRHDESSTGWRARR